MKITPEMMAEDEKRWHARDVITELRYCGNYMRDRKDMTNLDIRFYAYLMRKAHEMLHAQEPRVMTWDEMIEAGKEETAVFVEECPKGDPVKCFWGIAFPGMELPKDVPFNYPGGIDFNVTDVDGDIWDGDFYGMNAPLGWRAWTSRPSPEQMRDTPWEEMP